jgi:ribosome-associated heat shock protein Hsp15
VHVHGGRVRPARDVKPGDRLEIRRGQLRFIVTVTGLAERRGPASAAAGLYEEDPESIAAREKQRDDRRLAKPLGADLAARPTKRDRRRLDALRKGQRP